MQLREVISTPELPGSYLNEDNMVSEDDISSMCGSLLKKSADEKFFEFAHFSVREFLEHRCLAETPGLENYRISLPECHKLIGTQSLRYLQLSNFMLDPPDAENIWKHSNMISTLNTEGYSFHRLAATFSMQMTAQADSHSIFHKLMNSLFHPSKTSCFSLYAMSVFSSLCEHCSRSGLLLENPQMLKPEFAKKLLSDEFRPIHLAAALNLPNVCEYLLSTGSDPTTMSPLGTPLELSIGSFLRFLHNEFSSKPIMTYPYRLCPPIKALLPSSTRRNSTVEILERSSLEKLGPHPLLQPENESTRVLAAIIALVQNDFRVLQRLLSRGATFDTPLDKAVFREMIHQSSELIEKDAEPLLAFLQQIGSSLESDSGWQLEIGRIIWSRAVELGLPFTRDPTVTDLRITLSKDALVTRAIASIKDHDLQGLQECLADGRLDLCERHRDTDDQYLTLLHLAVIEDNLPATSHLAKSGCDPNISSVESATSNETWLPIHDCSSIEVLEELLAFGAHVTDVETQSGQNIWHMYASAKEHETRFFGSIAQRYPLETAEGLLTRSKDGHTPIRLVLEARESSRSHEEREERAMEYISICSDIVGFWSAHEPVFGAAAEFGSEKIIRRLIEAGARSDLMEPSQETPLHRVGIESSPETVQRLRELYPEALDIRYNGQLPLQSYLERCSRQGHSIEDAVAQQLLSTEVLESIDGKGTTLWEHYCQSSAARRSPHDTADLRIIWSWLLDQRDAMQIYEQSKCRSCLCLIFSCQVTLDAMSPGIRPNALAQAIEASCYWESAKNEEIVLRFLKFAIRNQSYQLVDVLLEHGVSVSAAVDGHSAIQVACQPPLAIELCSTEYTKETLRKMVELADLRHLNEYGRDGLTILHRLATSELGNWKLHWLIGALLTKGVDINKKEQTRRNTTPITYHLSKYSLSCAMFLLQMGADPWKGDENDAVRQASKRGHREFLEKVLERSESWDSHMKWRRMLEFQLIPQHGSLITLSNANLIHLTSSGGEVVCMAFYVDNNLIDDIDTKSTEGWTALHVAAFRGYSSMIEYLHSNGCRLMSQTVDGLTPLHLAVQQRRHDACKVLIRLGAKDIPDVIGMTPKMHASKGNDKVMVQLLSEMLSSENEPPQRFGGNSPHQVPKALITTLKTAIEDDDFDECKRLHMIGFPINVIIEGWSPLVWALYYGHVDIAEWLLNNGANITACMCRGHDNGRCFNVIEICLRHSECCKLLTRLVDYCIQDGSGWPLVENAGLLTAVTNNNIEGLSLLLKLLKEKAEAIRYCNSYQQASLEKLMGLIS